MHDSCRPGVTGHPTLAAQGSSSAQKATVEGVAMQDGAGVVQGGRAAVKSYSAAVQGYTVTFDSCPATCAAAKGGSAAVVHSCKRVKGCRDPLSLQKLHMLQVALSLEGLCHVCMTALPCALSCTAVIGSQTDMDMLAPPTPLSSPILPTAPPPPGSNNWCGLSFQQLIVLLLVRLPLRSRPSG